MSKLGFIQPFDWRTWQPNPNPVTGYNPYNPNTPAYNPNSPMTVNTNPVTGQIEISQNPDRLQQWINAGLSSLALIRNASTVPTTTPASGYSNNGQYDAQTLALLQQQQLLAQQGGTGASFGAGIESFVKNNTGLLLVGVIALVLFKSGRK